MSMRFVLALALLAVGCADREVGHSEHDVTVDTEDDLAWRQHQANLAFAESYVPRCVPASTRPRVLVTGFGRFRSVADNATGRMVERLLPELSYPVTATPADGEVDAPAAQLAVAQGTMTLPSLGEVDVCAMILPVFWDLAGALVLLEAESFAPDLVAMNGVARERQPVWIEMGAINAVSGASDGSSVLAPHRPGSPIIEGGLWARPNLATWSALRGTTTEFDEVLQGIELAGFPRVSNDYLCNDTTYVVGYGLDHPDEPLSLMVASHPRDDERAALILRLTRDQSHVPRWFAHWPSRLVDDPSRLDAAAALLSAQIEAQLLALQANDLPTPGDNALADKPADSTGGG